MKKLICLVLASLMLLSLVSCASFRPLNSPEKVAEAATKAIMKPDAKKFMSYQLFSADDILKNKAADNGMELDEMLEEFGCADIDELFDLYDKENKSLLEDRIHGWEFSDLEVYVYGSDDDEYEDLAENFKEDYGDLADKCGINSEDITSFCEIWQAIECRGTSEKEIFYYLLAQYNGKWYIIYPDYVKLN